MNSAEKAVTSNRQTEIPETCDPDGTHSAADLTTRDSRTDGLCSNKTELLVAAIGQIAEAVIVTDRSGTIQYVNPAFTRMTGYSAEEALGQNARLLKSSSQSTPYYKALWQTILQGQVWRGELINRRKNGSFYNVEMSITPIRDSTGSIANFIAIQQDVTDRRATEGALRSSLKSLEAVQNILPAGSWELDEGTNNFRGPESFLRLFDLKSDAKDIPFAIVMGAVPTPDREMVISTMKNTFKTRGAFDIEHRVIRRDGAVRVVRSRGQAIPGLGGGFGTIAGSTIDITEGRLAHERLRESEEKFRSLVTNIPDVTWSASMDGQVLYISPNVEQVVGFPSEDYCRKGSELWFERIYPSDCQRIAQAFQQLFTQGRPFDEEYRYRRKDGAWIWIQDRAYRTSERGGVRFADGIFSDITQRKIAAEELRRSEAYLAESEKASHIGSWAWDTIKKEIVYWSEEHNLIFGFEPGRKTVPLEDVKERIHLEDLPLVNRIVEERMSEKTDFEEDFRIVRADGAIRNIHTVGHPVFNESGELVEFVGINADITERVRAEEALKASEKRYRLLFERNLAGVFRTSVSGRMLESNEAAAHILGYESAREILDVPVSNFYHSAADREGFVSNLKSQKTLTNYEVKFRRKDGSAVWVLQNSTIIEDDPGTGDCIEGTFIDITARKRVEKELRQKQFSVEHASDAILWLDSQGRIVYANAAACRSLGYSPEEILNVSAPDFDPLFSKDAWDGFWKELKTLGSMTFESLYLDKVGTAFPVEVTSNYLEFDGEEYNFAFVRDISARKLAEEKVRESLTTSEKALKDLADQKFALDEHAIVAVTDIQGTITYVNEKFCAISKYAADELIGQNHRILNSGFHSKEFFQKMYRTIASGNVWHDEIRNRAKDGSIYWVDTTIVPFADKDGKPLQYIAIRADITERKRVEEEMKAAKEAAEAASRAKSEFLANMSHEFRTPMNGVIGMTELLLGTELTPKQRQFAEIVQTSGKALLAVINDILDLAKIEAQKMELERSDFDLCEVLKSATEMLAFSADKKGLEVTCRLEPGLPSLLRGDAGRLRQILINLVGNAIKFTQQGEVSIQAELDSQVDRTATLRFSVKDTGIGFPQNRAASLFEPFVQADGSHTRRYGGTGLGLTICKRLVEMMGGQIGAESEEGKGSTFWFTASLEKQPKCDAPPVRGYSALQNTKVLVVDDSHANRALVCSLLSGWGCRPVETTDGGAALTMLRDAARSADPFHVALLDLSLTGLNGEGLGKQIVSDPQLRNIALVLMTSIGKEIDPAQLKSIGFAGQVSKPVWEDTLKEALLGVAEKRRAPIHAAKSIAQAPRSDPGIRSARILLAEDNATNQLVVQAMLERLGYMADVVVNGLEATRVLRDAEYDMVLMDCEMPEMNGYEATRHIREGRDTTQNPDIPIIAITADVMSGDRDKCLEAGMSDYLAKPVELRKLSEVLEKWLRKPVPNSQARPPVKLSLLTKELFFNQQELLTRLMGDKSLAAKVIAGFLEDFPIQLKILRDKLTKDDAAGVRLQAHTLKGAAATISADALRAACGEAQEAAGAGELHRISAMLPGLEKQFELLKAELKRSEWV